MGDLVAQLDIDPARKAKVDAEVWLSELSELSSSNKCNREKIDSQINGLYFEDTGDLISKTSSDSFISNGFNTSPEDPNTFTITPLEPLNVNLPTIMNNKGTNSEIFRVSISSSAPSTSSSTHEEYDTYNEIYIWGENNNFINNRGLNEILTPKVLETDNLFIDIQNISCGASHAAVLTKNGEIFTWGEEYKGRLGHFGALTESTRPRLVNSLTGLNLFEKISCGEFHTCAVNNLGELYTWGDGILGHGLNTNTSIWVPKKVPGTGTGTMNNLNVCFVSCGTWHTALITTNGQLFTFGDGTFGVLGHNNRENCYYPKLVESLKGLKTINVSCSAWHTAGIVEVVSEKCTGGKLFTWGDGDKFKLGHGDKEPRLIPTCVTSLINHNLISVSCGHSVTICLTTLGKVFTMGSVIYGQLGNPKSDGKNPNLVQGPLINEFVREISCGSYHIALLTDKGYVFTWGKGNNGRLGHGDNEDKKLPTLVEGLKGKTVKSVVCGSNFTVAICLNKRVLGLEQNCCNICRQNFGFTRKKHTCYNCGFVHCNNCSAHKSFRASLAPNISKPYRVCDSCYLQLNNNNNTNNNINNNSYIINNNNCNNEKKGNHNFPLVQIKDVALNNGRVDLKIVNKKSGNGSFGFRTNGSSRPVSPFSRRPSPPRSLTPGRGFFLSKMPLDGLKKSNELLNEEVQRLRDQVGGLKQRCESQEIELKKLAKQASDASQLASEESTKSNAAKEVIKTLTSQLKEMADKIPIIQNNTNGALNKDGPLNDNNENIMQNNIETNKKIQSFINSNNQGDKEWIEQYEPGVYITLMTFHDGTRDLKRVRFSRRRFGENQAELWWNENREKVYEKYNVRGGSERVSSASSVKSSRV